MKKITALFITLTVAIAAFALPASAASAPTIVSNPENAITFPGGANLAWLTDGKIPEDDALLKTGFNTSGVVLVRNNVCTNGSIHPDATVTVELEKAQAVSEIFVTWYHQYDDMIGLPKDGLAIVGASADGITWVEAGMTIEDEAAAGVKKQITASGKLASPVYEAKYIRVSWTHGDSPFTTGNDPKVVWEWVALTEIGTSAPGTSVVVKPDNIDESKIPDGSAIVAQPEFNKWNSAGLATVETAIDNIKNHNPQGCTAAVLRPTDTKDVYTVVEMYKELPLKVDDGYFTYESGDIALMMSAGNSAWNSFNCLEAGDTVTFLGYDIENMVFADNAVAYFADKYVAPEVSDEPSVDPVESEDPVESAPAEDNSPAEDSAPAEDNSPADESKPAEDSAPADESKPAEKKGCGASVAATAAAVTSMLGLAIGFTRKKK